MRTVPTEGGFRVEPAEDSTDTYAIELILEREKYVKGEMRA
jgi:hypothetical protein